MISYSKVFKASNVSVVKDVKIVSEPLTLLKVSDNETDAAQKMGLGRVEEGSKEAAHAVITEAEETARAMKAAAEAQIQQWWQENEQRLEELSNNVKQQAYQEGYEQGQQQALLAAEAAYQDKMEQIQLWMEQAYEQKNAIISEAEPFLLELSTVIASQILKMELETHPEKFVELIREHILRFKEKESITVCVHPEDFEFIQSQRAHLIAVVNGETEIKIIPDPSVTQKGCMIRTAYGSVDARIDTQLEEIKKVMFEMRREPDEAVS